MIPCLTAHVSGPDAVAGPVYIVLVLPIGLAAYFGGFGPGLLSTLLTTLGAEVVLLEPVGGLFGAPLRMRLGLLMLGVIGVLVSLAARPLPKPFSVQALLDAVRRTLDTALV
ncbi:MAG: DUF4118 domain-containing protein [Gemmatimonadetes bacterium]|nr:DUF4118 domain-containing protein [Gemmatimonadota bacterium]